MPKIIKNLEEKIFKSAEELFCEKGYESVDMKAIARHCGIAVGTLYNYYANKKELYMAIVKKSWNETFEKLRETIGNKNMDINDVTKSIEILYDDIQKRRGLGTQINKVEGMDSHEVELLQQNLIDNIKIIFEDMEKEDCLKNDADLDEKIAYTLLANMAILIDKYPENKMHNINYITHIIKSFIKDTASK